MNGPPALAGLDHDNADGLDNTEHAQFRNYAATLGRWLSPDPYNGSYDLTNPQSLNRYAYVLNNPLSFTDPLGLDYNPPCVGNCAVVVGTDDCDGNNTACVNGGDNYQGGLVWYCGEYGGCGQNGPNPQPTPTPAKPPAPSVVKALHCASNLANTYSIAGALGLTEGEGIGSTIGTAFLGNTFSGIVDTGTHLYQNATIGGNGNQVVGDLALGGGRQGFPGGGVFSKGVVGVATESALGTSAASIVSPVTGEVTSLAAEGTLGAEGAAGPVGWIKLGIDGAIFAASAAYCYNHP